MTRTKKTVEQPIEEYATPVIGVGDVPDGDLENIVAEPIKPENEIDETVSEEKEAVFIYVGPTNKYLSRYTTYRNGYPLHLKEQLKEFPTLKSLFINPTELSKFERNVVQSGTIENIRYEKAKEYFNKAVK